MSNLYSTTNKSEMSREDRHIVALTVARALHEGDREGAQLFEDFARRAWGVRLSCREVFAALREVEREERDPDPDPTWLNALLADVNLDDDPEAEVTKALWIVYKVFPYEELRLLIESEPAAYVLELLLETLADTVAEPGAHESAREVYRMMSELHGRIYGLDGWEFTDLDEDLGKAA